jgi:hypothetical protein
VVVARGGGRSAMIEAARHDLCKHRGALQVGPRASCDEVDATTTIWSGFGCYAFSVAGDVRYWRKSGKYLLAASISHFDPLRTSDLIKI